MDFLKRAPLHPFLLVAYSVVALVALNLGKFNAWMALRSLVFFFLIIALLYWPLKWLTRSMDKSALVLSLFLAAFFTYGRIYSALYGVHFLGINFGWHRNQLVIWALLLAGGLIWILRTRRNLQGVTQALNLILLIALCFPTVQIIHYEAQSLASQSPAEAQAGSRFTVEYPTLVLPEGQTTPDIYYIILDTYARQDTLRADFQFDNSDFVMQLRELGFYIADCSQSNYATTEYSLSSSLNMNYLDSLGNSSKQIYTNVELYRLIQENAVRRLLEDAGYRVVAFDSGYSTTEWTDVDEHLARENQPWKTYFLGGINEFESLEVQTTAGVLLYSEIFTMPKVLRSFLDAAFTEHRERILYTFDELESVPRLPGPKFVFAHILAPHSPFVFGANGEIVGRSSPFTLNNDVEIEDPDVYAEGYRNQLQYVNQRTLRILKEIIAASPTPPIIILQGDHGPRVGISTPIERFKILNAYYFPGERDGLYRSISPVNTFRLLFNQYFQGQFELLPDISYYATVKEPDVFTVYPNEPGNCNP